MKKLNFGRNEKLLLLNLELKIDKLNKKIAKRGLTGLKFNIRETYDVLRIIGCTNSTQNLPKAPAGFKWIDEEYGFYNGYTNIIGMRLAFIDEYKLSDFFA